MPLSGIWQILEDAKGIVHLQTPIFFAMDFLYDMQVFEVCKVLQLSAVVRERVLKVVK